MGINAQKPRNVKLKLKVKMKVGYFLFILWPHVVAGLISYLYPTINIVGYYFGNVITP